MVMMTFTLTDVSPTSDPLPRGWRRTGYQVSGPARTVEFWAVIVEHGIPDDAGNVTDWTDIPGFLPIGPGADGAEIAVRELDALPNVAYRFHLVEGAGPVTVTV